MTVTFTVFGDVRAWVDDQPVDLGHARQKSVLAALLVDANQVVTTDQLIDRVWGDDAPVRARGTLHSYLARLRQALGGTEAAIVRRSAGYLLEVAPQAVDLHRFHHLVRQARSADDDVTEQLLADALALSRAEPLAHLDTPWAQGVRATIERARLAVALDHADVQLRNGNHAAALPELLSRAEEHPLDERIAGQLMLALHRSGRSADALHHYERMRHRLADELGSDPSAELQAIHQQVLTGETVSEVPHQLPAPPRPFTGRTAELAELGAVTEGVVVITGTGGVGKTSLAVHWAHQVSARFPDGQLYVNLRGFAASGSAVDPAEALHALLVTLGVTRFPSDVDGLAARLRSTLAGKRMLVVLDNAFDAAQVRPLLPGTPGCLVVITSRNRLSSLVATTGARQVPLDLPDAAEARDLLVQRIGARRAEAEPDAVADIVGRCARLPLALVVVAARAAGNPRFPLASVAAELRDLDAFADDDPAADVRSAFSLSYRALSPDAASLFRLLGLLPGPDIGIAAAASLAGVEVSRARRLLSELTGAHLVIEQVPGRFGFHDLLREYAAELSGEDTAALHRVLDHYTHTTVAAGMLFSQGRKPIVPPPLSDNVVVVPLADHAAAAGWLATERHVLMAAITLAHRNGFGTHAWQLAWGLADFLDRRGHWHDYVATHETALAAALSLDEPDGQARTHVNLSRAHLRLQEFPRTEAHLTHALEIYQRLDDIDGQASVLLNLGMTHGRRGSYHEAISCAERAAEMFEMDSNKVGVAHSLTGLAWCHARLGDNVLAVSFGRQALALHEEVGHVFGQGDDLDTIGRAHLNLGEHAQAIDCFTRAIGQFERSGNRPRVAGACDSLGDAYLGAGNPDAAREAWQRAIALLDDTDGTADHIRAKIRQDSP